MDTFLWWSGVAMWAVLSSIGLLISVTYVIEKAISYFGFYRTILSFAQDRARAAAKRPFIPAG